jgi:hypothetical protein
VSLKIVTRILAVLPSRVLKTASAFGNCQGRSARGEKRKTKLFDCVAKDVDFDLIDMTL